MDGRSVVTENGGWGVISRGCMRSVASSLALTGLSLEEGSEGPRWRERKKKKLGAAVEGLLHAVQEAQSNCTGQLDTCRVTLR